MKITHLRFHGRGGWSLCSWWGPHTVEGTGEHKAKVKNKSQGTKVQPSNQMRRLICLHFEVRIIYTLLPNDQCEIAKDLRQPKPMQMVTLSLLFTFYGLRVYRFGSQQQLAHTQQLAGD